MGLAVKALSTTLRNAGEISNSTYSLLSEHELSEKTQEEHIGFRRASMEGLFWRFLGSIVNIELSMVARL